MNDDSFVRQSTATAVLTAVLAAVALAVPSVADEPLRPPERYTACSRNGAVCAISDPQVGTFLHSPGAPERSNALWAIPDWYRVLWMTDDGRHLITGYSGLNLVPQHEPSATVVLEFWQSGELLKAYTLEDLGYPRTRLKKTVSHYHWGGYVGIGEGGRFRLAMLDGVQLVFDPTTGALVRREEGDG